MSAISRMTRNRYVLVCFCAWSDSAFLNDEFKDTVFLSDVFNDKAFGLQADDLLPVAGFGLADDEVQDQTRNEWPLADLYGVRVCAIESE